ncbi:MAG: hypothetical protein ACTHM0_13355 [Sphingomonas sp.]
MSKRLEVLEAVAAMLAAALDGVQFVRFDEVADDGARVPAGGRVVMGSGDMGKPDVDLSPLTYWYRHAIPVTVARYAESGMTGDEAVDELLGRIDAGIAGDRTLAGLTIWLEASEPQEEDVYVEGAEPPVAMTFDIIATYSASSPLA